MSVCGRKIPSLQHNGLEWSHIISKKGDGGNDQQFNCLALCPTCARAFDTVIKPAIYHAFKKLSVTNIPESWKAGENRINSEDGDVD
jgi:hypothetical protein